MSYLSQRGATGSLSLQANGSFQSYTPQTGLPSGYSDNNYLPLVGSRWDLEDGREVVFAYVGGSNIGTGLLCQDAALITNHLNLATTAFTAYSNNGNVPAQVTVTLGATAATLNQYQFGYAVVVNGTGKGQTLQIASHPAANSAASVVLTLADSPNTALDTTSIISLIPQPAFGVVVNPTTPTNAPRGVTLYPVTASTYVFLLTKGTVGVQSDASPASVGQAISPSTTTAGNVTVFATNTPVIGEAIVSGTSTQYKPVVLDL